MSVQESHSFYVECVYILYRRHISIFVGFL